MADNLGTLGTASVEIEVPLAGLAAGLQKARTEFKRGAEGMESDAKTHFGAAGTAAERSMEGTRVATVRAAKAADENFRPAMAASAKALNILGGIKAAGPLGELASSLTGAAMAAGPLGAALLTLTAIAFAFSKSIDAVSASNTKLVGDLNAQRAAMRERSKAFADAAREVEQARAAEARGSTAQIEALRRNIEQTKALLGGAINARERLNREQGATRGELFDFDKSEAALKVAEASVGEFYAAVQNQERALTTLVDAEARKRAEVAKKEAKDRAAAWGAGIRALMEQTEAARGAAALSGLDLGSSLSTRLAGIDEDERQANLFGRWRVPGVSMTRGEEERARAEMAARFEAQREQARNEARRTFASSRRDFRDRAELSAAEPTGPDDFAGQQRRLDVERAIAVRAATEKGEDVQAVEEFYLGERVKLDAEQARKRAKIAEEDGKARLDLEERVAESLLEADRMIAAERQEREDERLKSAADVQQATLELESSLVEITAEGVEARVSDLRLGYAKILADAAKYGVDRAALEAAIEKKVAEIRKQAAYDASIAGDDFTEGFLAELGKMRDEMQGLGGLGATTARTLRDGFKDVFVGAVQGADDLDERLSRLADRLSDTMLGWAFDQLLFAGLNAAFPGAGGAASIFGPTKAAEGGEWEVGGGGGHDSQMIAFKATPGERFRAIPKHKSWAGEGGGRMTVIVENHTGKPAEERRETGPGGEEIVRLVIGAVAKDIRRGGEVAQAVETSYGARRLGTRR